MSVTAVFVVEFHALKGNTLVFQQPAIDGLLANIEFRAMPSGSHAVAHDYSYYRLGPRAFGTRACQPPRWLRGANVGSAAQLNVSARLNGPAVQRGCQPASACPEPPVFTLAWVYS